jgi:uncharacterized RmlC-like cupin family protein
MDETPTCRVVRARAAEAGVTGFDYQAGISAETVGSRGLCLQLLEIPPGGRARPHLHEAHETAIYMLSGTAEMRYGEGLREHLEVGPGDFLYIPANMPHLPYNPSASQPAVALIARTDPNAQESVVLLSEPDVEG